MVKEKISYMESSVKVLTADSITINHIADILNEQGIPVFIKNNVESARLAGFGIPNDSVELYVNTSDLERAKKVIDEWN